MSDVTPPLRVALIADLAEECWPSMDLVADALYAHLQPLTSARGIDVTLVRPHMPVRNRRLGRYINRFWDYPRWLAHNAAGFDVYHVVDHSYAHVVHALPAARTLVTCHDVDAFMPLLQPGVIPTRLPKYFTRRLLSGLRKAALVTCDTTATRDEVLQFDLLPPDRLTIAHVGVQPALLEPPPAQAVAALEELAGPRDAAVPELLHVGSCIPRKRIDVLLRVLAAVARQEPRVRLLKAGGLLTDEQRSLARELGVESRIVQLPFIDVQTLSALYRRAGVSLTTSDREGFGLPVAEALACGTPVVATDIPVLREVGGSAVTLVPLTDIDAWSRAIVAALGVAPDSPARAAAREAGMRQAAQFTWRGFAETAAELYLRLGGRQRPAVSAGAPVSAE